MSQSQNLQTALEALENNNTVTTLNLRASNIGVNYLQEIENLLARNLKMKQVYLKENHDIDDIKMTLSFSLNRQKQEASDDEIFYNNIRGVLGIQPFCSLEKEDINNVLTNVLTNLFSDCPEKIEPFKKIVKDEGIHSLPGKRIKNAEEVIKNLSSSPSTSPETQSTRDNKIGNLVIEFGLPSTSPETQSTRDKDKGYQIQ